jgi:hypothetical protein
LDEFDNGAVSVAYVGEAGTCQWAPRTGLRRADELPPVFRARIGDRVKIIDIDRDMKRSHVARSRSYVRALGRAQILQELDVMSTAGKDGQQQMRVIDTGDLLGELPRQLQPMLDLEAKNIAPEGNGRIEVGDCHSGVCD